MGYFVDNPLPLKYTVTSTAETVKANGEADLKFVNPIGPGNYQLLVPGSQTSLGKMAKSSWFKFEKLQSKIRSYHLLKLKFTFEENNSGFETEIAEGTPFSVSLIVVIEGEPGQILKVNLSA